MWENVKALQFWQCREGRYWGSWPLVACQGAKVLGEVLLEVIDEPGRNLITMSPEGQASVVLLMGEKTA